MKAQLVNFVSAPDPEFVDKKDLAEILYSFSENDLWLDYVDSVGKDQAILCWRIVEKLRTAKLPDELKM
jgi:hypothetical protein